jgi:heat shock protein HslJ
MRSFAAPLLGLLGLVLTAGCGDGEGNESGAASFVGPGWILSGGIDVPGWEATAPSATFAEGRIAGSTGCNRFTGPYTVDGDGLEIGAIASTKMACLPPADEVERVYLAALARVAKWRSEGDELVLLDGQGAELLRYHAASTAAGAPQQ